MKITVHYLAQLKQAARVSSDQIELEAPGSVTDLLTAVVRQHPGVEGLVFTPAGTPQPALLAFLDEEQVDLESPSPLKDGSVLTLLSPMAGG